MNLAIFSMYIPKITKTLRRCFRIIVTCDLLFPVALLRLLQNITMHTYSIITTCASVNNVPFLIYRSPWSRLREPFPPRFLGILLVFILEVD